MPDNPQAASFASAFDKASEAHWRALVDKALKGADFDRRLVARTYDGIKVKPLYTRADAIGEMPAPGSAPYVRGRRARLDGFGWEITTLIDAGDASSANRVILEDLEGGANAVLVEIAGPGRTGVTIRQASDVTALLAGVYTNFATVEFRPGLGGERLARAVLGALPALHGEAGTRKLALNLDPVGAFARSGVGGANVAAEITDTVSVARLLRAAEPAIRTVCADGTIHHEAGASEAQELAAIAATLTAYLRAFEAAGTAPADALAQMSIAVAVDAEIFTAAAKLRAARLIVARIAEACGCSAAAGEVRCTAVTSMRMMARRDPWTNMLRTTVATAGAAFGGSDAIVTLPFTHALGLADPFARRIARNTQIVAQEESGLGRVIDPAGGSWYVENLTRELAAAAWTQFQDIERAGGMVASLRSGTWQGRIAAISAEREKAIATGRQELTGVSAFPLLGDDGVTVTPRPAPQPCGAEPDSVPLAPIRLAARFEALRDAADAAEPKPIVFLATLGAQAAFTPRATWITNLLASGGVGVVAAGELQSAEAAAEAFAKSGTTVAVIASSDAEYARLAEPVALALKAVGATHLALAGRPGDAEAGYRAAGIDRFIFAGQDAVATLQDLQAALGV